MIIQSGISRGASAYSIISVRTKTLLSALLFAFLLITASVSANAQTTVFSEGFDDISQLSSRGWAQINRSVTIGSTNWFQGNDLVFAAQSGAANSYIGANFNNTTGINTISNWLITPSLRVKNGDVLTFWTRCSPDNTYPDRLQVRLSLSGDSIDVGNSSSSVGDFTTLLLEINPTQITGVYPYQAWGQYSVTLSGITGSTFGRVAFRYYVTNGGPSGSASDYIGIDTVSLNLVTAAGVNVSGRVTNQIGSGIPRAVVRLTDANGNNKHVMTNQFGYYQFENVEATGTAIVGVSSKQHNFQTQVINLNDNLTEINFTAQD